MAGAGARTRIAAEAWDWGGAGTRPTSPGWPTPRANAMQPRGEPHTDAPARGEGTTLEHDLEALHSRCFGWALACCDWNPDEAADVLQATYLKILDGRARFAGRSQLSTFVYGVVRRTAAEQRRRRTRRRLLLERHHEGPANRESARTASAGEVHLDALRLREALSRLATRQREVLHLVFYEDLTIREAAEVIGVSLGTARVHYERGKKRLRALLADEEERT